MSVKLKVKNGGSFTFFNAQDIKFAFIKIGVKDSKGKWNFYMRDTIESLEIWDIR